MALVISWGWLKNPGPTTAGSYPAIFLLVCESLKELSVFIDESGDFGLYENHSPYYIVTLVFHDQSVDITENINLLNAKVRVSGLPNYTVHAGPLIRREKEYLHLSLLERKRIFNFLYNFTRTTDITYHPFIVEKSNASKKLT